jgi:hypothetical protein
VDKLIFIAMNKRILDKQGGRDDWLEETILSEDNEFLLDLEACKVLEAYECENQVLGKRTHAVFDSESSSDDEDE